MINMSEFNAILGYALTPITLISGIGLLMICMTARYNHTTSRIRQLMTERETADEDTRQELDEEIQLIFHRASLLRKGSLCTSLSAVCSALLVALTVFQNFTHIGFEDINAIFLVISIALIVFATILFSMEIQISLHALAMLVKHLPPASEELEKLAAAAAVDAIEQRHRDTSLKLARELKIEKENDSIK